MPKIEFCDIDCTIYADGDCIGSYSEFDSNPFNFNVHKDGRGFDGCADTMVEMKRMILSWLNE